MADMYTIISNKEELDLLIKKLNFQERSSSLKGNVASENSKQDLSERNDSNAINSSSIELTNFIEYVDYCFYKSIMLLIESIQNNKTLTDSQRSTAIALSRELMFCGSIKEHLLVSSLYTVRYILCDSYMRLKDYVYYSTWLDEGKSFLKHEVLSTHTTQVKKIRPKYVYSQRFIIYRE